MREGWKRFKLEELSRRVTVGFVGSMAKEYVENGVPMLRSQNIRPFNLDFNNMKFISEQFHKKIIKSSLKEMDVAIVRTGNPGVAAVIPENLGEVNCSDLVIVTPDQEKINPYFLCYYFNSVAKGYVNSQLVGAVQQHFNVGSAKRMEINLPNMEEQLQIVQVLKVIHDKIELNLQQNQTLEEMAMALYKHWFVDFGPFQEGEFVESELGMIPKGWEVKDFLDLFDLLSGGTPKTTEKSFWSGDINWVSAKDIGNNGTLFICDTERKITSLGLEKSAAKLLPEDTVIVVARGSVGKYGVIAKPMAVNQSCYGIYSKSSFSQSLTYLLVDSLIQHFMSVAYGSVFDTITTATFANIQVTIPKGKIITELSQMVDPLFTQMKENTLQNQTLTTLRDTLLPKLISGEIRVKDAQDQLKSVL